MSKLNDFTKDIVNEILRIQSELPYPGILSKEKLRQKILSSDEYQKHAQDFNNKASKHILFYMNFENLVIREIFNAELKKQGYASTIIEDPNHSHYGQLFVSMWDTFHE